MPAKKSAKRPNSRWIAALLRPDSPKKTFLIFLITFAVIGGVYKTFQSFAATGNPYACPAQPELQVGSTGDCVKRVQWYLINKANYTQGHITGTFDENTKQGVMNLQAWTGLVANGIVGPKTWNVFDVMEGGTNTNTDSGKPGVIQGKRVAVSHADSFSVGGTAVGTVTIDTISRADNPFRIENLKYGRHWVSAEAPAGWKVVGYSSCINNTGCHGSITPGTSVAVDVPSAGYVDIWWHYEYAPTAAATKPVYAPGLPPSQIKDHNCLVPGKTTTEPCTLAEFQQQNDFLKAAAAATTCIKSDLTTYTCSVTDHDNQVKLFTALTTCLAPTPANAFATRSCSVEEHNKQVEDLKKLATPPPRVTTVPSPPTSQYQCLAPTPSNAYATRPCSKAEHDKQADDLYKLAHPPKPSSIPTLPGYRSGYASCTVAGYSQHGYAIFVNAVQKTYKDCLDTYNAYHSNPNYQITFVAWNGYNFLHPN